MQLQKQRPVLKGLFGNMRSVKPLPSGAYSTRAPAGSGMGQLLSGERPASVGE